jgi:hypothetical protein
MKLILLSVWAALLVCFPSALLNAAGVEQPAAGGEVVKSLQKQASACMQKAMDCRVMGLNALKNADASRAQAHEALVSAMTSGDEGSIDKAKEGLDEAAEAVEDVIEDVEKVIAYSVKAELAARRAEDLSKAAPADQGANDEDEIRKLLDSSGKHLAKADCIAMKLRKAWLEPLFASPTNSIPAGTSQPALPEAGK